MAPFLRQEPCTTNVLSARSYSVQRSRRNFINQATLRNALKSEQRVTKARFPQAWTCSAVLLNMVGQGMALSYTSVLMPALRADDAEIKAELKLSSWIASSIGIAGIPGFFLASYLMDRLGRRIAHVLVIIPGAAGWLFIFLATNTTMLLFGRLLCGVTAGASVGLGAIVIGEYSSPAERGMFLNLKTAAVCVGAMVVHILGNFFYWRTIALLAMTPYVVALLMTISWPESPSWLAFKGRFEQSEKSFYWLRGKNENSQRELKEMVKAQMEIAARNNKYTPFAEDVKEFARKFTRKDFLMPVFLIVIGTALLEVAGRHIFPAYALDIVGEITGNKNQSFFFTLALDLIIISSVTLSSVLMKVMKRRNLLFSSGFAAVAVLAVVCTYLFLVSRDVISKDYPWVPIGLFIAFFILANLGCTPMPLAFLGELLPLAHRGTGSSLAGIIMSINLYISLQIPPYLLLYLKVYGMFAVLGTAMATLLTILYFTLPETKDKTLQEIEDYFNGGTLKNETVEREGDDVTAKMIRADVEKFT